ncbi:MAG: CPBP family intramembrane metalloprotease [Planctomycetes bacterium]|nr:CPBP family intramembrane metalloprotease [Planctomycetota bacterium]
MNWNHVRLIFIRELKDQLRDRRTMFTICVLPLLLYPFMGLMMLQLAQVKRQPQLSIAVVGESEWLQVSGAAKDLSGLESGSSITSADGVRWMKPKDQWGIGNEVHAVLRSEQNRAGASGGEPSEAKGRTATGVVSQIERGKIENWLRKAQADVILFVSDEDSESSLDGATANDNPGNDAASARGSAKEPIVLVLSNQSVEKSRLAILKLQEYIGRWQDGWVRNRLHSVRVDEQVWSAPKIEHVDIASTGQKQALVWSKILPFILLVWALTGAFYPAIDLCAGEKERGTLETLLSSPATRREIVWGKLLTVMCFSVSTALLNLTSMFVTTTFVFKQFADAAPASTLGALGPISPGLIVWLVILVLPMSAMFSALALAVASLARSSKEGQYYLMPLMLVGFPLVILPMMPGMVLSTGTSIVPVTGPILLSRAFMDGEYSTAIAYLPSVICVTVLCCLLAIRWAVKQFENESVLFSDTEKLTMKGWLKRLWLQRADYPSAAESVLCGLSILVALFFGRLAMGSNELSWIPIAKSTIVIQVGLMLGPTLIMAIMLTRSLKSSLRLKLPQPEDVLYCAMLAVCLHPTYVWFAGIVSREYPLGEETTQTLQHFDTILSSVPLWSVLLILAVLPALCEELVFRGFVFSGLLESKGVLRAVIGSAVLFGLSHGILQQSICATVTGLLLGWLAFRTGGMICTFVFHVIHNGLSMSIAVFSASRLPVPSSLDGLVDTQSGAWTYSPYWSQVSIALAIAILFWISIRPRKSELNGSALVVDSCPAAFPGTTIS